MAVMNRAKIIVDKFGGQSALAVLIGKGQTTVQYWVRAGIIPARWQPILLELAKERNIDLSPDDFIPVPNTYYARNNKDLTIVTHPKPNTPKQTTIDIGISNFSLSLAC